MKKRLQGSIDKSKSFGTAFILLASLSLGYLGGWAGSRHDQTISKTSPSISSEDQRIVSSESQLINSIAQTVGPSVVSIDVTSQTEQLGFFGRSQSVESQSAGTGIIISDTGYVITNRHVITGATDVSVTLSDGTLLDDVEVVGTTASGDSLDIGFLKIKDTKNKTLAPAKLGDSGKVQVGDKVVAIGNALGQFQNTVTSGIISGFGRSVEAGDESGSETETLQNLFQTDTAINQGNSGGPLVNINGEVIGINTAVAGNGAENIGFAIPVGDVEGIVKTVLEKGIIERPYLGIRYVSLTDDYAFEYNLSTKRGAYIVPSRSTASSIVSGSPADKAGLKEKDIITKVNDTDINEKNSLVSAVGRYSVGEQVELTIIRDGNEQKITVTLEAYRDQ